MRRLSLSPATRQRLLHTLGYGAAFFFSFLLFVYLTFPWERLVTWLLQEAKGNMGLTIDVEGFSPSLGTGITADKVTIRTKPSPGNKDGDVYTLENVSARISLLSLMGGDYETSFAGDLLGGHVSGSLDIGSAGETGIQLTFSSIDISQIETIANYVGMPVFGKLDGEFLLDIPAKGIKGSNGMLSLQIKEGKVGEKGSKLDPSNYGARKTPGLDQSVTLQEGASLGTVICQVEISSGRGKIKEFSATGGDIEASLEGSLRLNDRLFSSVLSGVLKFRFDEEYTQRNEKMEFFLGAPTLTQAKTDDGFFAFNINDPLDRLKFRPSRREVSPGRVVTPGGPSRFGTIGQDNNPGLTAPPRPPLSPAVELNLPGEQIIEKEEPEKPELNDVEATGEDNKEKVTEKERKDEGEGEDDNEEAELREEGEEIQEENLPIP